MQTNVIRSLNNGKSVRMERIFDRETLRTIIITAEAPAIIISTASCQLPIPPTPMTGMSSALYRSYTHFTATVVTAGMWD